MDVNESETRHLDPTTAQGIKKDNISQSQWSCWPLDVATEKDQGINSQNSLAHAKERAQHKG